MNLHVFHLTVKNNILSNNFPESLKTAQDLLIALSTKGFLRTKIKIQVAKK